MLLLSHLWIVLQGEGDGGLQMWFDSRKIEVTDFIGLSDEAARDYCYSLNDEERAIFRDNYIAFYRACLHIAVTGQADGLSRNKAAILSDWLRSTMTSARIKVSCRPVYFVIARKHDGIHVVRIGKYSYIYEAIVPRLRGKQLTFDLQP